MPALRRGSWVVFAAAATVAYSWLATATEPFTAGADTTVAVAIVAVLTAWAARHRDAVASRPAAGVTRASALPWLVLVALVTAWELATFLGSPRSDFPTLSSIYDSLAAHHLLKASAFLAWTWVGLWLATT